MRCGLPAEGADSAHSSGARAALAAGALCSDRKAAHGSTCAEKRPPPEDTLQRQITALVMATKRSAVLNEEPSTWPQHCREELDVKIAECLRRQYVSTQRLTNLIKILNATFLVILGALFVTFQFTQTDSHFAMLAQGFVAAMMATFIVYTMMAFTRIWRKLKVWLAPVLGSESRKSRLQSPICHGSPRESTKPVQNTLGADARVASLASAHFLPAPLRQARARSLSQQGLSFPAIRLLRALPLIHPSTHA